MEQAKLDYMKAMNFISIDMFCEAIKEDEVYVKWIREQDFAYVMLPTPDDIMFYPYEYINENSLEYLIEACNNFYGKYPTEDQKKWVLEKLSKMKSSMVNINT